MVVLLKFESTIRRIRQSSKILTLSNVVLANAGTTLVRMVVNCQPRPV
jgi:hypothetical protein